MPVDPKGLAAMAKGGNGGGKPPMPPKMGGGPPPKEPPDEDEELDEEEVEEEGEGAEDLAEKYGDLIESLEANASAITEETDMLDRELLIDPGTEDPDFLDAVEESAGYLDGSMIDLVKEKLTDVSWDDAMKIAEHLKADEHITDPEAFAGFLFHVVRALS